MSKTSCLFSLLLAFFLFLFSQSSIVSFRFLYLTIEIIRVWDIKMHAMHEARDLQCISKELQGEATAKVLFFDLFKLRFLPGICFCFSSGRCCRSLPKRWMRWNWWRNFWCCIQELSKTWCLFLWWCRCDGLFRLLFVCIWFKQFTKLVSLIYFPSRFQSSMFMSIPEDRLDPLDWKIGDFVPSTLLLVLLNNLSGPSLLFLSCELIAKAAAATAVVCSMSLES